MKLLLLLIVMTNKIAFAANCSSYKTVITSDSKLYFRGIPSGISVGNFNTDLRKDGWIYDSSINIFFDNITIGIPYTCVTLLLNDENYYYSTKEDAIQRGQMFETQLISLVNLAILKDKSLSGYTSKKGIGSGANLGLGLTVK